MRKTPIKIGGKNGIVIHDKLLADGPVDPETGNPLIDPATGEPYPGKNDDMGDLLHDYLVMLRSNASVGGFSSEAVARFGVLSLIAMNTPIFAYDHPAFKKIANTAFTDGIHVFIDADFMRKLYKQEVETDGNESGVLWTILHELMHKLYYHVDRMKDLPPEIANIAQDLVINGKLIKGFPSLQPVKLLMEICHGTSKADADKYYSASEELVGEQLLIAERQKKKKEEEQKKKQQQQGGGDGEGEPGQGQPGQGQGSGKGQPGKGQSGGKGQPGGQPQGGGGGGDEEDGEGQENGQGGGGDEDENGKEEYYSPIHHITPEDFLDILEKEGLTDTVGKSLNLPSRDDKEAIGRMKEKSKLNDVDAIHTAISQAAKCGGNYPGKEITEGAAEMIKDLDKGKLTWKLGMKKHIFGDGLKLRPSDEEADIPWFLTKESMGVEPWYMGSLIPQSPDETVLALIDTSGSTSIGDMRQQFISELISLQDGVSSMSDTAKEVIALSADTVLQGEPLIINKYNAQSIRNNGMPIFGNGGTDFARCMNEALSLPLMKKKKVKTVIYFTDCCDSPPCREDFEDFLNKGGKIVFITTPGMWNEKFNKGVSSFAEVYCIEENTQVDLEKQTTGSYENTRKHTA